MPIAVDAPPITEVHRVALAYADLGVEEAAKWKKRAKIQAALPRLQFDFGHRLKNNINIDINDNVYVGSSGVVVGPEEGSYKESIDAYRSFGVRAVWSLNELLFNRDSLNVSRQRVALVRERNILFDMVNKHYFERKKLLEEIKLLEELKASGNISLKQRHQLLIKRVAQEKETADLDALTGGWFSSQLGGK